MDPYSQHPHPDPYHPYYTDPLTQIPMPYPYPLTPYPYPYPDPYPDPYPYPYPMPQMPYPASPTQMHQTHPPCASPYPSHESDQERYPQFPTPPDSIDLHGSKNQGIVLISNLDYVTSRKPFESFGEVKNIWGPPQNFCVEFFDKRAAAHYVEHMKGIKVNGQPVAQYGQPTSKSRNPNVEEGGSSRWELLDNKISTNSDDPRTTVWISDLPLGYSQQQLLNSLDTHCMLYNNKAQNEDEYSKYDFVYLPILHKHKNIKRERNEGFAFVNLTSVEAVRRVYEYYHGRDLNAMNSTSTKRCKVRYADVQGLEALKEVHKHVHAKELKHLPVVFSPPRTGFLKTQPRSIDQLFESGSK